MGMFKSLYRWRLRRSFAPYVPKESLDRVCDVEDVSDREAFCLFLRDICFFFAPRHMLLRQAKRNPAAARELKGMIEKALSDSSLTADEDNDSSAQM